MSNHKVIATIDVSRPAGRKIVKELQNKRVVKLKYPLPEETSGEWHDWEEVYEKGVDKLSELCDTDLRELATKHNIKLTTTVFVEENVKVIIDITSSEGREIVEYLKQFPDEVTFESDISAVEESVEAYRRIQPSTTTKTPPPGYMTSEEFWEKAVEDTRKFCEKHDIL